MKDDSEWKRKCVKTEVLIENADNGVKHDYGSRKMSNR